MIIDFETRIIPPELKKLSNRSSELIVNNLIFDHPSFHYSEKFLEIEDFLSVLEKNKVTYICGRPLFWLKFENQIMNNKYILSLKEGKQIKYCAYGVPLITTDVEKEVVISDVMSNSWDIVEFIPSWQKYDILTSPYLDLLGILEKNNKVAAIEIGQFFREPAKHDQAWKVLEIAKIFPELKIVVPHFGGLLCWYELNSQLSYYLRNIYYVTSSFRTLKWINPILKSVNSKKIIFGTDFPFIENITYQDYFKEINSVESIDPNDIYCNNILRIMGD